jgi:nucleotide-binding universal stress UspA family protein
MRFHHMLNKNLPFCLTLLFLLIFYNTKTLKMKTVIVPVDFSLVSYNAADYAAEMLAGVPEANLVLYHMYEKDSDQELAERQVGQLKEDLGKRSLVKTETVLVKGDDLINEIERVVHHRHADFVIMGITGKSGLEQVFMGSNVLKLIDKKVCPVLIVPPDAKFDGVKNVAVASDFKDVRTTTPSGPIKAVLEMFHPMLHVVNINSQHYVALTEEFQKERAVMKEMFSDYENEFYFIGISNFYEAIEQFIIDKNIDILITIPRQHSFLRGMFKGGHTKKLAYHTHIPLLAVHE